MRVRKARKKSLRKIIASKRIGDIFVIEKKSKVVGMVNILYTFSTAFNSKVVLLEDMVVLKKYRGNDFGKKLLKFVLKKLGLEKSKMVLLRKQGKIDGNYRR